MLAVEQPFELFDYPNIDSGKITSCGYGVGENVPIQDARRVTVEHGLDVVGFTFLKHASHCFVSPDDSESARIDLDNEQVVNYLEETMDLVKYELRAMIICWFPLTGGRVFRHD